MDGTPHDQIDAEGQIRVPIGFLDELSRTASSDDVFSTYARWAKRIIDCDRATVALAFPDNPEALHLIAIEGNQAIATGSDIPIRGSFIGRVFETRISGFLKDISGNTEYLECPKLSAGGLNAVVDVPILVGDRCFGCLAVAYCDPEGFDEADVAALSVLARCLASYLLLHEQLDQLSKLALIDPLTQIYNRRFFQQAISDFWDGWKNRNQTFSLVTGDIDHFKKLNDAHGHEFGDDVLRCVADLLRRTARPQDVVARMGGEEFAFLLGRTTIEEATAIAERLRKRIEDQAFTSVAGDVRATMSFGVAAPLTGDESLRELSIRSDTALYEAKKLGRNRVVAAN